MGSLDIAKIPCEVISEIGPTVRLDVVPAPMPTEQEASPVSRVEAPFPRLCGALAYGSRAPLALTAKEDGELVRAQES